MAILMRNILQLIRRRNGGIGAEAMKQFLAFCGTPVVLEVEMPADEMSKRRIGFYERLGFKLDNHVYHQLLTGKVENGWRCGL